MSGLNLLNQLQYLTQEARRSVLYALTTDDSNRQVEYADQSRAADAKVVAIIEAHIGRTTAPAAQRAGRQFAGDGVSRGPRSGDQRGPRGSDPGSRRRGSPQRS